MIYHQFDFDYLGFRLFLSSDTLKFAAIEEEGNAMEMSSAPEGWYSDVSTPGSERWWDGSEWTDNHRPTPSDMPPPPTSSDVLLAPAYLLVPPPSPADVSEPFDSEVAPVISRDLIGPLRDFNQQEQIDDGHQRVEEIVWQRKRVLIPAGVLLGVMVGVSFLPALDSSSSVDSSSGSVEPELNQFSAAPAAGNESDQPGRGAATDSNTFRPEATIPKSPVSQKAMASKASMKRAVGPIATTSTARVTTSSTISSTISSTTAALATTAATAKPKATAKPTTSEPVTTAKATTGSATVASVDCHPAYSPCLPNLSGNAMNCGDIASSQKPITVYKVSVDPYVLDYDNNGIGCEAG